MTSTRNVSTRGIYPRGFSISQRWPWPLVRSRDLVQLNYGKALREADRQSGGIPVYGTNGQCGWHDKALASGPGVILGRKGQGPLGVEWCDLDFWVIDTAYFVTPKTDQLDLRYFYYVVKYIGLNHLKEGTSNPSLSRETFADLLLPVPPIAIQRTISRHLQTLDRKIDLNLRMNATLEAIAHAIFKSWFVDFDLIHMKREKREAGISNRAKDSFSNVLKRSDVRDIPLGWHVKTFGDVLSSSRVTIGDENAPTYSATVDGLTRREERFFKQLSRSEQKNKKINRNDLVFGLSRRVLNFGLMRDEIGSVSPVYEIFKVNSDVYRPELVERYIRHKMQSFMDILKPAAREGQAIDRGYFLRKPLIIPPRSIQDKFIQVTEPMMTAIVKNCCEISTLSELRDVLLPKLVSSEIRLKEADKSIGALV